MDSPQVEASERKKVPAGSDDEFEERLLRRAVEKREQKQKKRLVKLLIFGSVLIFYAVAIHFWTRRAIQSISSDLILGSPLVFFIGILFIWIPLDILEGLGQSQYRLGRATNMLPSPAIILRFLGWTLFIIPAFLIVLQVLF